MIRVSRHDREPDILVFSAMDTGADLLPGLGEYTMVDIAVARRLAHYVALVAIGRHGIDVEVEVECFALGGIVRAGRGKLMRITSDEVYKLAEPTLRLFRYLPLRSIGPKIHWPDNLWEGR